MSENHHTVPLTDLHRAVLRVIQEKGPITTPAIERELGLEFGRLFAKDAMPYLIKNGLVRSRNSYARNLEPSISESLEKEKTGEKSPHYPSYIYCFYEASRGRIKIGFANNVKVRFSVVQCATADELVILATKEGTRKDEAAIHRRFAAFRIRGEWFRDCPEIRDFIAKEMKPWPLP